MTVPLQELADKKVKAPWKPNLKSVLDTSYFDPEFTKLPARDTPASKPAELGASVRNACICGRGDLSQVQEKFAGFTYVPGDE